MVGAGSSSFPHERMWFSNYGSRIDVYGWGENVDTTTAEQSRSAVNLYTSSFSGTSSASPIIAGAATLVQSIAKENLGRPYRPSELRAILSNENTGTKSKIHMQIRWCFTRFEVYTSKLRVWTKETKRWE